MDGRRQPARRRRVRLGVLVGAGLAALATVMAPGAEAHALLSTSDPSSGAALAHSPSQITITFTEQPDPALSTVQVLDTSGHVAAGGRPVPVAGQAATVRLPVPNLPGGVYTVNWRTVSKVDGHLASGAYSFGVGVSPAGTSASGSAVGQGPRPSTPAVAARWVYFAGLIGLLGLIFTELVILAPHPAPRRLRVATGVSWAVGMAGAAGITEAQRRAANLPVSRLLSSSLGHSLWLRSLPLVLAGALLLLARLGPHRRQRAILAVAGVVTLLAMLSDADTGHAAASSRWEWFRVGSQWVHFAAVGIWIGGLAGLLLCLGALAAEDRRVAARRYSSVAAVALVTVVVSGSLRAFDEIGSWHQLFHTGFGQLVVVKVGLLGGLVALGALNRFRSVPAAGTRPWMLRRVGGSELGLVAVVLIASAVLLNLAPSRSSAAATAAAPARPLAFDAHDAATTLRLHLTVTPGAAGFNQFGLTLADYDSRAPVDGVVSLRFSLPARPDLGDSTLPMRPTGPGAYTAQGPNLSIDGAWTVSVLVQRPSGAVEVPVTITPRVPPQNITVQRFVGTPDISTLHLPGNRSVQVYLDPGRTGAVNEFHVTFIGPDNNELATDTLTVAATGPAGGLPVNLTVRKLDPIGHFVADLRQAAAGRYSFDVNGTTAQGETIHGIFTGVVG